MGKAKKGKKKRTGHQSGSDFRRVGGGGAADNSFLVELTSLEPSKRLRAIRTIGSVCAVNQSNVGVLSKYTTSEILSKLIMRLLDSNDDIRAETSFVFSILANANDDGVQRRLYDIGLLDQLTNLFLEEFRRSIGAQSMLLEKIIATITNLISQNERCLTDFTAKVDAVGIVISLFCNPEVHEGIRSGLSNLLLVLSDSNQAFCQLVMDKALMSSIYSVAFSKPVVLESSSSSSSSAASSIVSPPSYTHGLITVQAMGVLNNIFAAIHSEVEGSVEICKLDNVLHQLSGLINVSDADLETFVTQNVNSRRNVGEELSLSSSVAGLDSAKEPVDDDEDSENDESTVMEEDGGNGESSRSDVGLFEIIQLSAEIIANIGVLLRDHEAIEEVEFEDVDDMDGVESEIPASSVEAIDNQDLPASIALVIRSLQESNCVRSIASSLATVCKQARRLIAELPARPLGQASVGLFTLLERLCVSCTNLTTSRLVLKEGDIEALLPSLIETFDLTVEAVPKTNPNVVKTGTVTSAADLWAIDSSNVDAGELAATVVNAACAASDAFMAICKYGGEEMQLKLNDNGSLQRISLSLIQAANLATMELVVPVIEALGAISNQPNLPVNICVMLTNCVLRRMSEPAAYSQSRQLPPVMCSYSVLDSCINSLIDMHSGDALPILDVYRKLDVDGKLSNALAQFSSTLKSNSGAIPRESLMKFKETCSNGRRFLKYKADFIQSLK